MNIRDLQYLVTLAELGHFGQAAAQCCVSQPTLSGQIKKLESELGVTLFERTNRRVIITAHAKELIACARRILHEVDTMKELAQNAQDPLSGTFRLGAFPTLASYIFPDLAPKITVALPQLRLILIEDKTEPLIAKLRSAELDAALLALPIQDGFLTSTSLFDDEFYLAVAPNHELARFKSIDQRILSHYRLLLLEEGHCLRDQALEICQRHHAHEEQDFRATGLETLRQMVKARSGITFMPKIAIAENEHGIRYIPFKAPAPKRTIGLVYRKTSSRLAVVNQLKTLICR